MRTININLIGDLAKTPQTESAKTGYGSITEESNRLFALIFVLATLIVFSALFGGWYLADTMTKRLDRKLLKLNADMCLLQEREKELSEYKKNLKAEKELLKLKVLADKQISATFYPWSMLLDEIAMKIPKNVVIKKIERIGSKQTNSKKKQQQETQLKITGIMPPGEKSERLIGVSLFIFNLNKDENSLVEDANITKLELNDETSAYDFEIETLLKPLNNAKGDKKEEKTDKKVKQAKKSEEGEVKDEKQ